MAGADDQRIASTRFARAFLPEGSLQELSQAPPNPLPLTPASFNV
jgi:hypothetical protein